MRITAKGQVTIPAEIRARAGLLPHTEVEFALEGGVVTVRPVARQDRGMDIVQHMRGRLRDSGPGMTTDEIMALTRGE